MSSSKGESGPQLTGYQYVALRCVPRVDREEFVNIGVVLYSQAADFLCAASSLNSLRLTNLFPELDLEAVAAALRAVDAVCCGDESAATLGLSTLGQRFGWLAAPKSTVVQPGPIHGGLTDDPSRQLEHLLQGLVGS
ncbi:DUF3037 domain-containing protein [Jatrophihabitans sp. DSM 45814]